MKKHHSLKQKTKRAKRSSDQSKLNTQQEGCFPNTFEDLGFEDTANEIKNSSTGPIIQEEDKLGCARSKSKALKNMEGEGTDKQSERSRFYIASEYRWVEDKKDGS